MITMDFLIKLFIKESDNTSNSRVREDYGKLAGAVGIASNLLLFILKIIVGLLSNSISIIADAVNNLSDSGSSLVTLLGFKISGKPADARHPYGHARVEYIAGLIISFFILFFGLQLLINAAGKVIHPQAVQFNLITLLILAVSILIKLWQRFFYNRIGDIIDSTTLTAAAMDSRNDILTTGAVLTAALITYFTGLNLDGYMGTAVALFIIVSGVKLIIDTVGPLIGMAPEKEMVESIYRHILGYDKIIGLHDLAVHSYGVDKCFASVHCEVSADQDIMVSHDIIDNIERQFASELGIHLVIHLDPVVTDDPRTNALKVRVEDLLRQISPEIGMHDFRVVWGISHSNLIFDVVVPFDFQWSDDDLKTLISDGIHTIDASYHAVITVDHHYVPGSRQMKKWRRDSGRKR